MVFRFVPEAHWRKQSSTELNPRSSPGPGIRHVWVGSPTLSPRASLAAQMVKNLPAMQETRVQSLGWKDSPGGGHGNPLQYSCLENPRGQRSQAGYSPRGHKELDMTKVT